MTKLLIANRGEIAIRIARAAAELGMESTAVYAEDDARALHVAKADSACPLRGSGAAAYLDAAQIVAAARTAECNLVHPGYGFLSENADFARRCADAGLIFAGPRPELLELFGDKVQARALALRCGVPVLRGSDGAVDSAQAHAFFAGLGEGAAMVIKAVAGGGGRGMRVVQRAEDIDAAHARCRSEARSAFGNDTVYVEQLLPRARHVEIQVLGDGSGAVAHLGERECSLQRRHQKLVEIAPSPSLGAELRERIAACAVQLAETVRYNGLGTFEFLVGDDGSFVFIEANPRLQVEHTVTEAVTGVDLVQTQLRLAQGESLAALGLLQAQVPAPRGYALQLRINTEVMGADGGLSVAAGTLAAFDPPSGPGVRVDTCGYTGYATNPAYDPLLAKLIVHSGGAQYGDAVAKAYRALCEFRIEGVATNQGFLQNLLRHPDVIANRVHTGFIEACGATLLPPLSAHQQLYFEGVAAAAPTPVVDAPVDSDAVTAPMPGRLLSIAVAAGAEVRRGQPLAVMEAMKMEHDILAPESGVVRAVAVSAGAVVAQGQPLLFIEPAELADTEQAAAERADPAHIRPDLAEVLERRRRLGDAARPEAVARRRKTGQRTARENIEDLCDPDSFVEYGALALASQRHRRSVEELEAISPADGMVCGIGDVNGAWFGPQQTRCAMLAYDYTVFAGTQGYMNHKKKDRLFELAERWRLPLVMFAEGGGGRPGDDWTSPTALDIGTFGTLGRLSALVPMIAIVSGRCFAGNAALVGCCDVIIATRNANIGMGGPAMIEGGGLGVYRPEEVGPVEVQAPNGVIDVLVEDEAEATRVAKQYLAYFQGPVPHWQCADQRLLRQTVPENRVRSYDIRAVIDILADSESVLELRPQFGTGMITALIRIEGRPLGLIANNPLHLGGAIDADGADKAARFMQLCDAFNLPLLSLCDTPGFMVGPEVEKTAQVRHVSRLFVTAASLSVPMFVIVLRKGYGLGAQAMAGGSFHGPLFTVAWPTGEFGAMGLEGAVRLGYRRELDAIADPEARRAEYERLVAEAYREGKALNIASYLELDDVIDPLESRRWITRGLAALPAAAPAAGRRRPCVDTW